MADYTPKFSVVIPLYNKQDHIRRTLESVLDQQFTDYEVIVVDDGSTDRGPEVVTEMLPRFRSLRFLQQENTGVSVARNRGIEEARGEGVAFLDADDVWMPEHLKCLDELWKRVPDASLYGTGYMRVRENLERLSMILRDYQGEYVRLNRYFYYIRHVQFIYTSSIMIPRAVLKAVGSFPPGVRNGEDLDLWARAALHGSVGYAGFASVGYICDVSGQATGTHAAARGHHPEYVKNLHRILLSKTLTKETCRDLEVYLLSRERSVTMRYATTRPVNLLGLQNYILEIPERAFPPPRLACWVNQFPVATVWRILLAPWRLAKTKKWLRVFPFLGRIGIVRYEYI
jgi:GT2 family glycosyltransferase